MIEANGITLRVVVEGQGPLLILLHGFPQCWYLWRHQIGDLVAAGYQVAVPDQRGFGGSDKPDDIDAYKASELIADVLGIADALGRETFTLVTHDFGAVLGWDIARLHPERVSAIFALSVPPAHTSMESVQRLLDGGYFLHFLYFQQPGVAEAELDADVSRSLRMLHYAMSGDAPKGSFLRHRTTGSGILSGLIDPEPLPGWLSKGDLEVYLDAYRDGFRGPLSWYRGYYRDEVIAGIGQVEITMPCHLMVGSRDASRVLQADGFANVQQNLTDLRGDVRLDGAGHWLQLERTTEVNSALMAFLRGLSD
ncbi:alpha/beta fold hydrolase [Mycobacterium sp. NPDC003449]